MEVFHGFVMENILQSPGTCALVEKLCIYYKQTFSESARTCSLRE